jgi:ribonuclease BN (tRNA processing enzyme)
VVEYLHPCSWLDPAAVIPLRESGIILTDPFRRLPCRREGHRPMARPQVQFLGTGTAFHHDGRGSQCVLVRSGHAGAFLVDVGPTALAAVMRYGVPTPLLDRLFVTHLHGDHVAGWPFLLLHLRFIDGRRRPLEVHGATGLRACLEGLAGLCYGDLLAEGRLGFEVVYRELPVAPALERAAGSVRFDALPMDHHPTSLGYVFDLDGCRVAVSGDTRWCPNLERLARSADYLILECTTLAAEGPAHVSLEEIREGIGRLGGCELVLVHLPDEVAAALSEDPLPRVVTAYDGLVLDL